MIYLNVIEVKLMTVTYKITNYGYRIFHKCVNLGIRIQCYAIDNVKNVMLNEPRREKTGFLHMRKQRRRSASR